MTITEFLTARLDEESRFWANPSAMRFRGVGLSDLILRMRADVAAKRAIVALHSASDGRDPSCSSIYYPEMAEDCETLRAMLQPFADHPDYDKAWRV